MGLLMLTFPGQEKNGTFVLLERSAKRDGLQSRE
jgi:hypothetical protein